MWSEDLRLTSRWSCATVDAGSKATSPSGSPAFLTTVNSSDSHSSSIIGGIIHTFQSFLPHQQMRSVSRCSAPDILHLVQSRSKSQRTVFERHSSSGGDKQPKQLLLSSSASPLPTLCFFSASSSVVLLSSSSSSSWSLLSSLVSCDISKREILP